MAGTDAPGGGDIADVLVTVDAEHRGRLAEVSRQLKSAGLTDESLHEFSGIIAGRASVRDLARLQDVEGVTAVEREPTFGTQ